MEMQNTARVLTLRDLWRVFARRWAVIVLAAVLGAALLFAGTRYLVPPKYESTATLYVLRQGRERDEVYTQADFTLALNVVNDCAYMLQSREVLDDVITQLAPDMQTQELERGLTVENPEGTRVLEVSVITGDARLSKELADAVCRIGAEKIAQSMGVRQVSVYAYGTLADTPCSAAGPAECALAALLAAVLAYTVCLVAYLAKPRKQ